MERWLLVISRFLACSLLATRGLGRVLAYRRRILHPMRRLRGPFALAALTVLLVVSLAGSGTAAGSKVWKAVKKELANVPCEAEVADGATSANLKTLRSLPWPADVTTGEVDIEGDLLLGHVYASPGGLVAVDISNPLRARILNVFRLEGRFTYDVKITTDGSTAVLGFDDGLTSAGIAVVDIRDPLQPKLMDEWVSERPGALQNGHMLYTEHIDETDWVFLAPNDSTGVWILKLVGEPGDRKIELVTQTLLVEGGPLGPHDMYIGFDKDLETWVLYAADGYEGWLAYDIGDPATPSFIGGFLHPSSGYTHTIQAGKIAGKRIVATVEEVGANFLKIYDATNLAAPILLGTWAAGDVPIDAQHNLQIVGDHLYIAHYGQGIYVFDLAKIAEEATPLTTSIEPVALYAPEGDSFWDIVVKDGLMYGGKFSAGAGLDVFGFGCVSPGAKSFTSTG